MGVPGPVTSAPSQGVHELIRSGAATLVTGPEEVLELVGAAGEHLLDRPRGPERPRDRLTQRHGHRCRLAQRAPGGAGEMADAHDFP